jgi:hypothetical protein
MVSIQETIAEAATVRRAAGEEVTWREPRVRSSPPGAAAERA